MVLMYIPLVINKAEYLFMCLLAFSEVLAQVIYPLRRLGGKSSSYWFIKYILKWVFCWLSFFYSVSCLFTLWIVSLNEDFKFESSPIYPSFPLWLMPCLSHLRNLCQPSVHEDILLCFSFKSFIVLFIFRSTLYLDLELIFMYFVM